MPEVLDRCVQGLKKEGYPSKRAWAICTKRTGWVKAKGGGWVKKYGKNKGAKHSGGD